MISLEAYISLFLTPLPAFSSATVPRFRLRAENKEMSYIPTEELKKYRVQVEEGVELVRNCAKVLEWTDELKSEYTNKFIHLEKTLGRLQPFERNTPFQMEYRKMWQFLWK